MRVADGNYRFAMRIEDGKFRMISAWINSAGGIFGGLQAKNVMNCP